MGVRYWRIRIDKSKKRMERRRDERLKISWKRRKSRGERGVRKKSSGEEEEGEILRRQERRKRKVGERKNRWSEAERKKVEVMKDQRSS